MLAIILFLILAVVTTQAQLEGFIVGGELTSINRYPHAAFLDVTCVTAEIKKKPIFWICGSSIINQRILITAAHCLYPCGDGSNITVNMGAEHRHRGVVRSVSDFIIHENYDPNSCASDIGMIKMAVPVRFSSKISRVAIMAKPPYSGPANLAGWGLIDEKAGKTAIMIKSLDQKVWQYRSCQQMFGDQLPRGTICASSPKLEDFAAAGDSGSGLVVKGYIQIGLVSYKIPRIANNVIVYTDVGYYYEWITYHAHRIYCFTQTA